MTAPKLDLAALKAADEGGRKMVLLSTSESSRNHHDFDWLPLVIEAAEEAERLREALKTIANSADPFYRVYARTILNSPPAALERSK